jgi:hypothetical protein
VKREEGRRKKEEGRRKKEEAPSPPSPGEKVGMRGLTLLPSPFSLPP